MRGDFPKLREYEDGRGDPVEAVAYEDIKELEAAFEVWDADYGEIERYDDDDHTGMVQLDHGHQEYEHRVRLVAALRSLFYGERG